MANLSIHLAIWLVATVALFACTSDALFWGRRLCRYNGRYYRPGNTFPARDGCNRCVCMAYGNWVCTRKACFPNPVCPKPTGFGICVELCSRDEDCFAGQKCCSNGCGHVCTTIQNCAVISCLTPNCTSGVIAPPPAGLCCPTCGCNTTDGNVVRVGESFPAGDGCNTCSCTDNGPRCTLRPCIGCKLDNGTVVPAGTSFPASDGCNTCTCQKDGQIACTEIACPKDPVYQ